MKSLTRLLCHILTIRISVHVPPAGTSTQIHQQAWTVFTAASKWSHVVYTYCMSVSPGMVRKNTIFVYRNLPSCCHVASPCIHDPSCCTFAQLQTQCWPARCQRNASGNLPIACMADVVEEPQAQKQAVLASALQARDFNQGDWSSSRRLTWESPGWPRTHISAGLHTRPPGEHLQRPSLCISCTGRPSTGASC